jgi:hypothetical protein
MVQQEPAVQQEQAALVVLVVQVHILQVPVVAVMAQREETHLRLG